MTTDTTTAPIVDERVTVAAWTPADDGVLEEAQSVKAVDDAADYEYAAGLVVRLRAAARAAETYYKPWKQAIDRIKRAVLDREYDDATAYDNEASRIDKVARAWMTAKLERERAEKDAADRAQREEAERIRQETVERMKRAAAAVPDATLKQAIANEAEQMAAAPVVAPKSTFVSAVPKVRGYVPSVTTYSAEVTDLMLLVKAVAAGTVPLEAVQANAAYLNRRAVDSKDALAIPGVKVVKTEGSRTRG